MIIQWGNDTKQYVIAEFDTLWQWPEFHKSIHEIHEMTRSVDHKVDLIIWHKVKLPPGNMLSNFQAAFKGQPSNTGRVIIISPDSNSAFESFMKALANVIERVFPLKSKITMVGSIEEALAIVTKREGV